MNSLLVVRQEGVGLMKLWVLWGLLLWSPCIVGQATSILGPLGNTTTLIPMATDIKISVNRVASFKLCLEAESPGFEASD
jgi:hypothetical protein